MTRNAEFKANFSAGVLSPLLRSRIDYQRTQTGVRDANGFLPLREGGMMRSPGTVFWDFTRQDGSDADMPVRLFPFEFNADDSVLLEFYDSAMRVRRYGTLVPDGAGAFELPLPYDAAAIQRLNGVQSADVIYLADGARPIQKLSRFALDAWTIADNLPDNGPFRSVNTDKDHTITPSAATGSITLTANFDIFQPGHIGGLLKLEPVSWPGVPLFQTTDQASASDRMRNDGKVYALVAGDHTGFTPPIHEEGIEQTTRDPQVWWQFISTEVGIVRITGVSDLRNATATVIRRVPEPTKPSGYATAATYRWAFGAWSNAYGYPALLALYDGRMFAARTATEPRTIWASAAGGGYLDFEEGDAADDAFTLIIDGDGSQNPIQWMAAGPRALHIGAQAEEYSLRSISENTAVAVSNARMGRDSAKGSSSARPVVPDGSPIFIGRDKRRLFEITYVIEYDANIPRELSFPARHLGADPFEQVVHQGAPMSLNWVRRKSGDLVALTYDRGEDTQGWAPVSVAGGVVEEMAVTRAQSDGAALLVLVVRREIDGATRRCIEAFAAPPNWPFIPPGDVPATHFFCAAVFTSETPADSFLVPHLAGATVRVWADGADMGEIEVESDGTLNLPYAVSRCEAGFFDPDHFFDTFDLGSTGEGGLPGAPRRVEKLPAIQLYATQQGYVQTVTREIGRVDRLSRPVPLINEAIASTGLEPLTGAVAPPLAGGFERETSLRFTPHSGASMTILATTTVLKKGEV